MRSMLVMAVGMLGTGAHAAPPEVRRVADLDNPTVHVSVGRVAGASRLVVTGPSRTWLLDPDTGETLATLPRGFHGTAAVEDGPLFACDDDGLWQLELGTATLSTPQRVDPIPCAKVAVLSGRAGTSLVALGETLRVFPLGDDGAPGQVQIVQAPLTPPALLAVDKRRFAVASLGGDAVYEEGPWGTSALRTGGAVGGLTAGPSAWVWSLPDEDALMDVTRARVEVAPGPGALLGTDLDGDRVKEILVSHPESQRLGVVQAGTETLLEDVPAPAHMVSADLDEDACEEVVLLSTEGRLSVLSGACGGPDEPLADATETSSADSERPRLMISGIRTNLSARVGTPLELQLIDPEGRAMAWNIAGGPPSMSVSSTGVLRYPVEVADVGRWQIRVSRWIDGFWVDTSGIELTVHPVTSLAVRSDGAASSFQDDLTRALDEDVGRLRRSLPFRGCSLGVGAALGGSRTRSSWVLLGQGFLASGSPAVSVGCDGGQARGAWWTAGLDSAPFFAYVVNEQAVRHGLTTTIGGGWTDGRLSVGAYGTVGLTMLGVGPVARFLPFKRADGSRHGPELRFTWLLSGDFTFESTLYYTFQLGPYR